MRRTTTLTWIASLLPICIGAICDPIPPPPATLSSPAFSGYDIVSRVYDGEHQEMIRLAWLPDSTDTVSVVSYQILRRGEADTFTTPIRDIAGTVQELFDPTVNFVEADKRDNEYHVFYRIFAFDSLGRPGDTSVVCTVSLARFVKQLQPLDTFQNEPFKWQVPPVFNLTLSHVILWKGDSTLWTSDTIRAYTQGGVPPFERSLPQSFPPLIPGKYFWSVHLKILGGGMGGDDALSIITTNFYVK